MSEIQFLRSVYNTFDLKTKLLYQKRFPTLIPPEYIIVFCDNCSKGVSCFMCDICGLCLCAACSNLCFSSGLCLCDEHFVKCPLCTSHCACPHCRVYVPEKICSVCSEHYESFTCGCEERNEKCIYCQNKMDEITSERQ